MSKFPKFPATLSAPTWYSAPRLWRTLSKAALSAGRKTLLTALTLFYCLQDRDTPTWAKGVIVGALGYLVLPTDLIPDIIPGIGYGDDWGALVAALGTVAAYIKDEHKSKALAQVERLFGSPNPAPPPEFIE
ncbi:MAG: YkvA family protein [Luteolibacter sp.]|uniref:YkvA family protein n=1 Tax=Luteolibacter sp. TaxID=1962973 RepID=UPI0032639B2F